MVAFRLFCCFCLLGLLPGQVKAQEVTCKWVSKVVFQKPFILDSLSVLEETIVVQDKSGNSFDFFYQLQTGQLTVTAKPDMPDSLRVCYRTFPLAFHQVYAKRTLLADYDSTAIFKNRKVATIPAFDFREELFQSSNLAKTGNLTRGVSFGNTQNLFVNSSLNLQMSGELAENLNIRASISDQNVPFQPEGNTQQLQDFDNVLVELYNERFNLAVGDVVLQQRRSEFLRYYKNVQGAQITTNYAIGDKWKGSTQAAASVAKGRFASIALDIQEGTLGPYRIKGPANERFVIVMANSERVFLDGVQLQRGFNYDYVIDYNQGEITFTPKVLITKYSRVRIDFEFAERNFQRSILTFNHIQETEKLSLYMNFYREQDNRNRPLFVEFTEAERRLLASVGNAVEDAVIPRIDSVAFDPNRILYRRVISIDDQGMPLVFFEYSVNPSEAFFSLNFSEVGQGNGDYVREQLLANGQVFTFRPRINGVPQGNFSIVTSLPAPNKNQMFTLGSRYKLSPYEQVYTEVAFSNADRNLFSSLDNQENKGMGIKSGLISDNRPLEKLIGYRLSFLTEFEYNSSHFSFIDRLRYIEFDRDWSLSAEDMLSAGHERIFNTALGIARDANNVMKYRFNWRNRGSIQSGVQHLATWNQEVGSRFQLKNEFFYLDSDVRSLNSQWLRYTGDISYRSKVLVPGYRFLLDQNAVRNAERDSVVSTAMNFQEHLFYLKSNDTLKYSFFVNTSFRGDKFPVAGILESDTEALQAMLGLKRRFGSHDLSASFTYRELTFLRRDNERETTVLGKVDYLGNFWKGNIRNELSYALGNGREFRREFIFLPVPTGEGTHTWRDDNGDGIQQLNEFFIAINPEEKNFIKIFVPTAEFVQAYTTIFNYRVNAKFPDAWRKEQGWRKFAQKFSNTTSVSIEKKITSDAFWDRINPLAGTFAPEDLISVRQVIRSSYFFNRSSANFGIDFSIFDSQNKQLLAGGFDDLKQQDLRFNTRKSFGQQFNLRMSLLSGRRLADSDFLENRKFDIEQRGIAPEIAWQPHSSFRTTLLYQYTLKKNLSSVEIDERSTLNEFALDLRYAKAIKTTLNTQLKYIFIAYNGQINTPTGYEMLQALTPGNNLTWSFNWLQKIGEGLQMNMIYEGRNSQGLNRLVHIGRMQVTALF